MGPVSLEPDASTQSVRKLWSVFTPLHHRVSCVCRSPGDSVIETDGELTWAPSKKLMRWVKVTDEEPLFTRTWFQLHR